MINFLKELELRDASLYYFGWLCLLLAVVFIVLSQTRPVRINGVNAWYKPIKFCLSIFCYGWTMGWLVHYLPQFNLAAYNITTIVLLGFEIFYIALQAGRGQLSHYNVSTGYYRFLYGMMGLAASVVTLYTAYIGLLFFARDFAALPAYYLWSIRLGIMLFVVFAFEGAMMGAQMSHAIGNAEDDDKGLPFLGWSRKIGDARVAHFIGMHALQILPLLSFYLLKSRTLTIMVALLYAWLAVFTLIQALKGKAFIKEAKRRNLTAHLELAKGDAVV